MDEHEKKTEASLLQPREGAGKYWWETFLRGHISDINRRFNQAKALYITVPTEAPLDLFSYIREAALCFEIARYLPAIAVASQSVELILKRDRRMQAALNMPPESGAPVPLSPRNIALAASVGLPADLLLSSGETLDPEKAILFVQRHERVIRGDVTAWFHAISEYVPSVEREALDQLEKAQKFVVAWFNNLPDADRVRGDVPNDSSATNR
jgi:hypothetical protein